MKTPMDFKIMAKFHKVITHDKRLKEVDEDVELYKCTIKNISLNFVLSDLSKNF